MADKIKKFFQKKKADVKFKTAGPGRRLTDSSNSSQVQVRSSYNPKPRSDLSSEAKQAAEAALARLASQKKDTHFNTSLAAIQAQVKRELEAERKKAAAESSPVPERKLVELDASPHLAASGVYFKCPIISNEVLSKQEWKDKIKIFLYEQLESERGLTACLIIHSCNKSREKIKDCIEILCKYLENIVQNPTEEKYQKIRMSNKTFCEKVQPIEGALEFLMAAGFNQRRLVVQGIEEDYLVFDFENLNSPDDLEVLMDALKNAEPIPLELDRNLRVLLPSQASRQTELPSDFYSLSPEEMKREQQLRAEAVERNMQLRTKAMREKDEIREMRKYRFALIRIRFPEGVFLQGTFAVFEPLNNIYEFVHENIHHADLPFMLTSPTGHRFHDDDGEKTLIDLRLVPAAVLYFEWDPSFAEAIRAVSNESALKPDVLMLCQSV